MDEIEPWVIEHYGNIGVAQVKFPQFNSPIVAVSVAIHCGTEIGMGINRQLAIHDLYLRLTTRPTLKTNLPPWWQERYENWKRSH